MITGELKNKIDSLWDIFAAGGLVNPLDVIEQITYLMFIHDLDDTDNLRTKEAAMLGLPYQSIFADEVQVGDTIIVEPNEVIPLDGEVLEDMSAVDISPLTGRAGTRTVNAGGAAMSGSINLTRTIRIRVTREFKDSTVRRLCDIAANTASVRSGQERRCLSE